MRPLGPRIRSRTGATPWTRRPRTCARSSPSWLSGPRPQRGRSTRSPRRSKSAAARSALVLELPVEGARQALAGLVAALVVADLAGLRRAESRWPAFDPPERQLVIRGYWEAWDAGGSADTVGAGERLVDRLDGLFGGLLRSRAGLLTRPGRRLPDLSEHTLELAQEIIGLIAPAGN